jgi:hypothetical protein
MITDIKQKLAFAILDYLRRESEASQDAAFGESLSVAQDCLASSYGVSLSSKYS